MSNSVLFLVLALCVLVRSYVISKDVHQVSCFEEDSPGARDADVLKLKNDAENLATEFRKIEGLTSSKYELFRPVCKKIEAKIISELKLSSLPRCDAAETDLASHEDDKIKIYFTEVFFNFMCNLKNDEYQGLLKWERLLQTFPSSMAECSKLIERKYSTSEMIPDFCGEKVTEMQTCIQGILTGEDDAIAFVKALTADYKNVLCLKDISDERYERRYNHKNQHSDYNKLIKLLF